MKQFILIIFSFFLLLMYTSCKRSVGDSKIIASGIPNDSISLGWTLENEELKKQILSYINTVDCPKMEQLIEVVVEIIDDSTHLYTFNYILNAHELISLSPHLFFELENNLICVRILGLGKLFKLSEESVLEIVKSCIPHQYEIYQKYGHYGAPITYRPFLWELTFVNGRLVKKEEDLW